MCHDYVHCTVYTYIHIILRITDSGYLQRLTAKHSNMMLTVAGCLTC